jgi:signal transduction histidine kinase
MGHRKLVQDAALALILGSAGVAEVWVPFSSRQGSGSASYTTLAVLVACVPLVLRRRFPLAVAAVVLLAFPLLDQLGGLYILFYGTFVPMGVAVFTIARHGRDREPWVGAGLAAAVLLYLDLFVPLLQDPGERVFHWGVFTLTWLAGAGLRRHERRAQVSARRAVEADMASAERSFAAVAEERARIARELHDVVAHSVSLMVVQAGAAELVVSEDPEQARRALEAIRCTGGDALDEMRRLVTMLRDSEADLAPQPGLSSGLTSLVEETRSGNLDVRLEVTGEVRDLPAGLDLVAYRIVQEALSNVRRHARASRVDVRLGYGADLFTIGVHDDGTGVEDLSPGHGLIGMRERAMLYGGRLETATSPGFLVRALLPVASP